MMERSPRGGGRGKMRRFDDLNRVVTGNAYHPNQGTGKCKRLTSEEKRENRKQRKKKLRRLRRLKRMEETK